MTDQAPPTANAGTAMTRETAAPSATASSPLDLLTSGDPLLWNALLDDLDEGVYVTDRDRRILFWNQGAEAISGFDAARMVGSFCRDNLLVHVDAEGTQLCGSSCPLEATMSDGRRREAHVFLHHSAGHRVPVHMRALPVRDASGQIVGAVEVFATDTNAPSATQRIAELEELAYLDTLTGLANRRYLESQLEQRFGELKRYGWLFGIILLDVDHFKEVNDRFGHHTGDEVLLMVAKTLGLAARSFDLAGRWGGDEFLVVVANVDRGTLIEIADRFRALVRSSRLREGSVSVTVSAGAALASPDDSPESLFERADRLLYRSKREGRDRTSA